MPFASTSTLHSLKSRSIPLVAATVLSTTIYAVHIYNNPALADDTPLLPAESATKKSRFLIPVNTSPYTPLGWGTNKYLTLWPESSTVGLKRPTPLTQLGSTPLRDLVIAEKYGACVDAKGDSITTLVPTPGKVLALSKGGSLYVVSASKAFQDRKEYRSERSWWNWAFGTDAGVDFIELKADGGLKRGEKWAGVTAGAHHVLAVTSKGRTFSLPLTPSANSHRQLGTRQVFETPFPIASSAAAAPVLAAALPPQSDIRFAKQLTEIPSLKGLEVAQVAASDRTSFARTPTGRVLGWGANESGQIGLGSNAAVEMITVPVEIVLAKSYPGGTVLKCTDIKAGGQMTFFTVERALAGKEPAVDLLACGNGLSGSLGNGLYSNACGVPTRVKTGLQEYSEKLKAFIPLGIHNVSISPAPSAHVFAVLDTVSEADPKAVKEGLYGKDVMVWGGNFDYQIGNGKRSSLAVPQHLPALVSRFSDPGTGEKREASWSSGTSSPMPHSRLQLHQTKTHAYDLDGKLIKRNVACEEVVVAGWNASVLYNKIIM